jgi:Ca-activated chloride channel family protein
MEKHLRLIFFAFIIFSLSSAVFAQVEEEVIAVDSSLVLINAAVFDASGRHVPGLKQKQFKVFDNGAEQEIGLFAAEETPFAAVILLDTSGSMEERVSLARSSAINFLNGLRTDHTAAMYRFDSKVTLVQSFTNSRDIDEKIFDLKANGMTVLNDAVFEAAEELAKRPEKRRATIVISDGEDTMSKRSSGKALKAALAANASIYTIDMATIGSAGARRSQNQGVLKNYAEKTGGTFIATPGGVAMRDAFKKIVDELGVQYTIGYQPSDEKKDGKWRTIEVRVSRPNLTIRTRQGYTAEKPANN